MAMPDQTLDCSARVLACELRRRLAASLRKQASRSAFTKVSGGQVVP